MRAAALSLVLVFGTVAPGLSQTEAERFARAVEAVRIQQFGAAIADFEALAESGDHLAQFNLATLLRAGKGRPQNFSEALRWALLAQLGGVRRAAPLAEELAEMLPREVLEKVRSAVDARLLGRLDRGERAAILQYARFRTEFLEEPDLETALKWQMIGAALSIPGALEARDETADTLDIATIVEIQAAATQMFMQEDLPARFAPPPAPGTASAQPPGE